MRIWPALASFPALISLATLALVVLGLLVVHNTLKGVIL